MRNPLPFPAAPRRRLLASAALAVGLAAAAVTAPLQAQAQTGTADRPEASQPAAAPPAPATGPNGAPLGEVTVEASRRQPEAMIPADKRAEYDAEVKKQQDWQRYRTSMQPLTADSKGISDPNEMSVDYPGLSSLLPSN